MSDSHHDLRSTAESIRHDAEQVAALEGEKSSLDPTDPRVGELSERLERLGARLQGKTAAEKELTEEVQGAG
jgi:hypothetical protein